MFNLQRSSLLDANKIPKDPNKINLKTFTNYESIRDWAELENSLNSSTSPKAALLRFKIPASLWKQLAPLERELRFGISEIEFQKAFVFVDSKFELEFVGPERVGVPIYSRWIKDENLEFDLILVGHNEDIQTMRKDIQPFFATTVGEFRNIIRFESLAQSIKATWLTDMALIVMALFVLILYLFVDSSTETQSLALFLAFGAASLTIDYGWLPFIQRAHLSIYASEMSLVFQIYFITQLGRLHVGSTGKWFLYGNLFAIPYAIYTGLFIKDYPRYLTLFESYRGIAFTFLACTICIRVAYHLRSKKVPWRVFALLIAGTASTQQLMNPIQNIFVDLGNTAGYDELQYTTKIASWLMLSLSAFVNIASLESRVKALTEVKTKQGILENELKLAQSVQTAFMKLPPTPPSFDFVAETRGQLQVSGDSYYLHWSKKRNKLYVMLNDVTGHGIQAAIKASACQVIAQTCTDDIESDKEMSMSTLEIYSQRLRSFFRGVEDTPDIVAFAGCEIDASSGEMDIYRSHFTFPFLVDVSFDSTDPMRRVKVEQLTCKDKIIHKAKLTEGSFIVFMSDGYTEGSRDAKLLYKWLAKALDTQPSITAESIQKLIYEFDRQREHLIDDDKTLLVIQWKGSVSDAVIKATAS